MDEALRIIRIRVRSMLDDITPPAFYRDMRREIDASREMFESHPMIRRLIRDATPLLADEFGHGMRHSSRVAVEAGAIVLAQPGPGEDPEYAASLALICGMLHDLRRMEDDHARKGALTALDILKEYPIDPGDKERIAFAIRNHEAFSAPEECGDRLGDLLAGALYDADKFRWGPDNFADTLWEICEYCEWTAREVADNFPKALKIIESVSDTFRTETGRRYGPEFIETGLDLGRRIQRMIHEALDIEPDIVENKRP